jgi:ribosomal protein S18 acetylase RimI-like enzyme
MNRFSVIRITSPQEAVEYSRVINFDSKRLISMVLGPALYGCGIVVGVASYEDLPIGIAWSLRTIDPDTYYFAYIAVDENWRNQGVAENLDAELVKQVKDSGARWGFGMAHPANNPSNRFLTRVGWKLLGEIVDFYGKSETRNIYCRIIASDATFPPPMTSRFWRTIIQRLK